MANWISRDRDLKKHEEGEKPGPREQGLFGIVKGIYYRINRSKPVTVFSGHQTMKIFEDHQRMFELQKSKAIMYVSTLKIRAI